MNNAPCFTAKIFRSGADGVTIVSTYAIRSYGYDWAANDRWDLVLKGVSGTDEDCSVTIPAVGDVIHSDHAWRVIIENMAAKTVDMFTYKGDNRDFKPKADLNNLTLQVRALPDHRHAPIYVGYLRDSNVSIGLLSNGGYQTVPLPCFGDGSALQPYIPVFPNKNIDYSKYARVVFTNGGNYMLNNTTVTVEAGHLMDLDVFLDHLAGDATGE